MLCSFLVIYFIIRNVLLPSDSSVYWLWHHLGLFFLHNNDALSLLSLSAVCFVLWMNAPRLLLCTRSTCCLSSPSLATRTSGVTWLLSAAAPSTCLRPRWTFVVGSRPFPKSFAKPGPSPQPWSCPASPTSWPRRSSQHHRSLFASTLFSRSFEKFFLISVRNSQNGKFLFWALVLSLKVLFSTKGCLAHFIMQFYAMLF